MASTDSLTHQDLHETLQSSQTYMAKAAGLPETLTLRGPRVMLKTPRPEDDDGLREMFSDLLTVKWLRHFHRSNGWSSEEIAARREKQIAAQREAKGLTLFIHVRDKSAGDLDLDLDAQVEAEGEALTLAGTTGFPSMDLNAGKCEIGIILHHPYWGKGIATEALYLCLQYAFDTLGVETVDWVTSEENKGMRRWCEGLQLRCHSMMTEEMGESLTFQLSRAEWGDHVGGLLEKKVFSRKD